MQELLRTTQAYRLLKKECNENVCSHAYLLLYNDARNIRFALKTFAKAIFDCDGENGYLSGEEKRRAKLIEEESFADCLLYPAENKKLSVEDAENIREESLLSPVEGKRKVFLIGDFAEANTQTQNKLLKLLEEPPEGVVFLLGATTVFPVLPTVLSRTKKLEIQPFTVQQTKACLERIYEGKCSEGDLEFCAVASGGNIGEAQNIYEGGYYGNLVENAFALCLAEPYKLPSIIKNIGETKHKKELLSLLRMIFRDGLLLKTQDKRLSGSILLRSEKENLQKVAGRYSIKAFLYAQDAISEAEKQVQFNAVFSQCIGVCISNINEKNK